MPPPLPTTAYPGLQLGSTTQYVSGPGTHIFEGQVVASLLGQPSAIPTGSGRSAGNKFLLSIPRSLPSPSTAPTPSPHVSNLNVLPDVSSLVLARVVRVRSRQVDLGILCVSTESSKPSPPSRGSAAEQQTRNYYDNTSYHVNADAYPATIRREDIRATEKDKIVCAEMFRVGDVVRAEVISVGDSANYYVTTARNELGVIVARSEVTGDLMAPISWKEFQEVDGGRTEARKVAKPF